MTDTERKEVEELAQLIAVYAFEFPHLKQDNPEFALCMEEYIAKRLNEQGYSKRHQDNNALVPLDEEEVANALVDAHGILNKHLLKKEYYLPYAKTICAKFGKDNSGMVLDEKELSLLFDMLKMHKVNYLPELLTQPTGIIGIDQAFSTFKIWLSKLSQQPPKERKVSLEEIKDALFYVATNAKQKAGSIKTHVNIEGDLLEISARILSLLNATEERKGEE